MKITLYLDNRLINYKLPNEIYGNFSFYNMGDKTNLINIEALNNKWYIYSTSNVSLFKNNVIENNFELEDGNFYVLKKQEQYFLIYVSNIIIPNILTYSFNQSISLTIANNGANINYNCPYLNNLMVAISYKNNELVLEKNGDCRIYINKMILKNNLYSLNIGDELEIYGLRIIFLNGLILVNNVQNKLKLNMEGSGVINYLIPKESKTDNLEYKDVDLYNKEDYFSKSPRLRRIIETKTIKLSAPPRDDSGNDMPILLVIGPMLTMGIISISTVFQTIVNIKSGLTTVGKAWPQLLSGGMMLVSMLVWPVIMQMYSKHIRKKKHKELVEKYTKYLDEKRNELYHEAEFQKIILYENLINLHECLEIIKKKGFNFWDKRNDQSDFLVVRIGKGNELLDVKIEYPEEGFTIEENELRQKADALVEEFKYINDVPIGYSFYENRNVAIMGNYLKTSYFMNNIILQVHNKIEVSFWRVVMSKSEFIKGMGIGLAVGAAAGAIMVPKKKPGKNIMEKTIKAMGDFIDNVADSMGI